MTPHSLGYALLCLIAPITWGLLVFAISTRIEARVLRREKANAGRRRDDETIPLEYHI